MGKKVYINEHQLAILVNYIKENEKPTLVKEELLEEGAKEWAMVGLMTLASMAGMAQDKLKGSDESELNQYIEAADDFKSKLADKSSFEYNLFNQSTKNMNAQNIEALKQVNPKDKKVVDEFKTSNLKTAKSKIEKDDYVVVDITITSDTTFGELPKPLEVDSTISLDFDGDFYGSGKYGLSPEIEAELASIIEAASIDGGEVVGVEIIASTDQQRLPGQAGDTDGGNVELSQKRSSPFSELMGNLTDVDIDVKNIPNNDGSGQSNNDRNTPVQELTNATDGQINSWKELEDAIDSGSISQDEYDGLEDIAQDATSGNRYTKVNIKTKKKVSADENDRVMKVVNNYDMTLVKTKDPYSGKTYKFNGGKGKVTKKLKNKSKKVKCDNTKCYIF